MKLYCHNDYRLVSEGPILFSKGNTYDTETDRTGTIWVHIPCPATWMINAGIKLKNSGSIPFDPTFTNISDYFWKLDELRDSKIETILE